MNTTHNRDLVVVTEEGTIHLLYPTTNAPGVLIDGSTNKMGLDNKSVVPSDIETLEDLINLLGPLTFQKKIEYENLKHLITTSMDETKPGFIPDATVINELIKRIDNSSGGSSGGSGSGESSIEIDTTLTESGKAADAKVVGTKISNLQKKIDDLSYTAIVISAFSNNKNVVEKGSTVTDVILSYTLSKLPQSARLDGSGISISTVSGSIQLSGLSLTTNKSWTLVVTDERDASASKSTSLNFYNGVYYGVSSASTYNNSFITSLANKVLSNSRARTVTVNANAGQYIYYCVPASLGTCSFNVGGFDGGFTKVSTISFTNPSGYTENYDIYKSDNAGLGNTTVKIS